MGQEYLIDTNVLIDAQMGRLPEKDFAVIHNLTVTNPHLLQ